METLTLASIGEEINKHLVLVADLRARRNSFLPIFRLPPETLVNIFTLGARDYYYHGGDYPINCIPHWVNVSYICRHWRNVALNCPALWAYPFTISLRWTEELLARSKRAPLKIHIYSGTINASLVRLSGLVAKLLSHAERIQELRLRVPAMALPSKLSLCVPHLQILDIDGTQSCPSEWTLTINDRDIPSLRTLKLTYHPLPWHLLNLTGLTTLFLSHAPSPQNIVEFLAALSRMQCLAVLHLDCVLASARGFLSSGAFDVFPKINLPSLARFFVIAPLSVVVSLLSHVDIPLKTILRLEFQAEVGSSIEDYAPIPSLLAQRFTESTDLSSPRPTIRSLAIRYPPYKFTLCASKHEDPRPYVSTNFLQWNSDLPLAISVEMKSMLFSDWDRITSDICCSIPSTDVQTLHVFDPPLSHDFWRKTLSHLHGLQKMSLSAGHMPDLVSLFNERVGTPKGLGTGDRDGAAGHAFVPALSKLELYRITFASEGADWSEGVSEKSLFDSLATRNALHSGVTMLGCTFEGDESDTDDDEADCSDESY